MRLFTRYLLSLAALFAAVVGGYFCAAFICYRFPWSENNPLYYLLKVVERLSPVLIVLLLLAGFVWFTVRALRQPLGYLDDVITAAESLSDPAAPPIELPKELSDVENELNLARSRSQENLRARREAEQRKNDLIMYLAHDLKTPLSSVIGYLTLLHDEGEIAPALREKYLSIALDKANRLEDLINEFFEITRFNLSAIELQYGAADLSRLLEQLTFEFQPMLREKNSPARSPHPRRSPFGATRTNCSASLITFCATPCSTATRARRSPSRRSASAISPLSASGIAATRSRRKSSRAFLSSSTGWTRRAPLPAARGWALPSPGRSHSSTAARSPARAGTIPSRSPLRCP